MAVKAVKRKKKKDDTSSIYGFWKHVNEFSPIYIGKSVSAKKKFREEITSFTTEVNSSNLPVLINENFVKPYFKEKEMTVKFTGDDNGTYGNWHVKVILAENIVKIDPVGLFVFSNKFKNPSGYIKPSDKENFPKVRLLNFLKETGKLPEQYFMFLGVLQEIVFANQIFAVENKEAFPNKDNGEYFSLLWAVKQFEEFYQKIQVRSLRSDYGIIWHESEWIDAPK